ncbi:hypothetical protein QTJ16_005982 [Diplocarpon rosae]|uniref:Phosphoinositide phospholipase C n=1 Tax=Diplocarpon rosae TaxID=946125 RepID=A0AAD9SXM7_9HELO|nr:hypothetical protein QTJ16_005982 [Diplocarpon rosae]PBP15816.1 phosphatidylinositol-specific phospholipase C [Diplocarpon rosae]
MPLLTPSGNQFSLHKLVAMSTMMSPTHTIHFRPLVQAGGGDAASEVPAQQLYLSHGVQGHLGRVYDALRGAEPTLSRAKLEAWLTTVQQQPITNLDAEDYKLEQFLEAVYYHRGFEAVKDVVAAEKDLTKPLSNYYISSSHNTYLSGNQLMSRSTTDAYKNVLIRGCRCIEIDVHNGEAPDNKSIENLSLRTSRSSQSPHAKEHKRHYPGSTLSSRAAAAFVKADEKYETVKRLLAEKTGIGRESINQDERGRKATSGSLEVGNSFPRTSSVRSTKDGEPLVLHGWTLTAPVGFRAVCKAIRDAAFVSSKLPLIVSLEVHADLDQQEVMVEIMKEEWKGLLVDVPHEGCDPEQRLPRLEELMEKILIKVKKAVADKQDPIPAPGTLAPSSKDTDSISGSEDERPAGKKKVKICENLSNLAIYTHSEHFVSFDVKSATKPSHIFSIGEKDIQELHETQRHGMFSHNRNFFMRAYPGAFRIDSSNVDPSEFWRKGVQMVALNWQKLDEGMMLNEGMFAGEHGWVLKPPGYRSDTVEPIEFKTLDLKITVLAGQHIPLPEDQIEKSFHPYVRCELHVEKEQEGSEPLPSEDRKRKTGYQKGDHPDFGEQGCVLQFPTIKKVVEELSFVRFKIEDARYARDDLAAWACIRLDRLQQGYRFVYLLDVKGQATPGLLLIKVEKKIVPAFAREAEISVRTPALVEARIEPKVEANPAHKLDPAVERNLEVNLEPGLAQPEVQGPTIAQAEVEGVKIKEAKAGSTKCEELSQLKVEAAKIHETKCQDEEDEILKTEPSEVHGTNPNQSKIGQPNIEKPYLEADIIDEPPHVEQPVATYSELVLSNLDHPTLDQLKVEDVNLTSNPEIPKP